MAYPASHLWWCQLSSSFAGANTFLGAAGSGGRLEISSVKSPSTNWQILPSEAVYYIRNEAAGPQFQLGLSPHPFTTGHEPHLVSISLSSTEQQWALEIDGGGARIQNVALGDLGFLNLSRNGLHLSFGEWGNSEELWHIDPVKMIDDASFLKSTQISLTPSVGSRSVPNATSSSEPLPVASHYIAVGPAAAAIALALALIVAVFLWRYSPKRRKRLERQSEIELAVVNCVPEVAAPDAQEPLPQYHARSDDRQPPPPDYSARAEEGHPEADGTPPEYSRPAAGQR